MRPRHWLDLLVGLRDRRATQKTVALGQATQRLRETEGEARAIEGARQAEEASIQAQRRGEAQRLQSGSARALDLQHGARQQRQNEELLEHWRERERGAREQLDQVEQLRNRAQGELSSTLAEAEVAHRAQARRQIELGREQQAKEDEAADEAWLARFATRRNG